MTADPPDDDADDAEEALTWDASSRDASYVEGPAPVRGTTAGRASTGSATGAGAADGTGPATGANSATESPATDVDAEPAPTSSFLLVTYGILGGVYALYAVGWITTVLRNSISFPDLLSEIMYQLGEFLAIASAPVWFAAVFVFTRNSKPLVRLLWLLLGLILLVPVPFVLGV